MRLNRKSCANFMSVYLPHDGFADEIIANTYKEVDELILIAKRKKRKLIIGQTETDRTVQIRGLPPKSESAFFLFDKQNELLL